jgi:hypothetical protein
MSLVVVAAGAVHVIQVGGFYREADEGLPARLFQLLMPAQLPIIGVFAATQLERDPTWARPFIAVQVILFVAIVGLVFAFDV